MYIHTIYVFLNKYINNLGTHALMCMITWIIYHLITHYYKTKAIFLVFSHLAEHHDV